MYAARWHSLLNSIEMMMKTPPGLVRAIGGIGGGYGPAFERSPELVLDDVLDGYLTRKAARRDFGVAVTPKGRINRAATAKLRSAG